MPNKEFILAIKAVVPQASEWVAMTQPVKAKFRVLGLGLKIIATKLGLPMHILPVNRRVDHCLLGAKIYGDDDPVIKEFLEQNGVQL